MKENDEAPSHVLFSAFRHQFWTYPKVEPVGDAYPAETYTDGTDLTFLERPGIVLAVAAAMLLGIGAVVGTIGWSVQRLLRRRHSCPTPEDVPVS